MILQTNDLTFGFGGDLVTDRVSLAVRQGEFLSVIGPNGAGKTTYFNLLSGMYRPANGSIVYQGHDITHSRPSSRARLGIARSFQTSNVFPTLTVHENARLAAQALHGHRFQLLRPFASYRRDVVAADRALDLARLTHLRAVPAGVLSHGDKRKLELAMSLASGPQLLMLDEPTSGLSAEDVPGMVAVIRRVWEAGRTTVIMVEHKMGVVRELSDRIAVLHQGKLLALGTPAEIAVNEAVQSAYLGRETI